MIGIVVSRADEASTHIGETLLDLKDWSAHSVPEPDSAGGGTVYRTNDFELREFDALHIHLINAAAVFSEPDMLVFASRHSGDTGPLLSAHFTGNFGSADFGGAPGELARASPNALKQVLTTLRSVAPTEYDVAIECTHHGPTDLDIPSMFVEVGSSEAQWRDPAAAEAVAEAILGLRGTAPDADRTIVGFGGGHYAPRFERIIRETDWAVGHIGAEWGLDAMDTVDAGVIRQAFEQSRASRAVLDGELPHLVDVINDLGYRVVSETWVRETSGTDLSGVEWAESNLTTVDNGLRFGSAAPDGTDMETYEIDPDLIAAANGVSRERVRAAVAQTATAFVTQEGGNRVTGRVAIPANNKEPLVSALMAILADRFDTIDREDDLLAVTETVFDPDRARDLGVPEGPAFGALANGESVTIDGTEITPEMVHVEQTRQYQL